MRIFVLLRVVAVALVALGVATLVGCDPGGRHGGASPGSSATVLVVGSGAVPSARPLASEIPDDAPLPADLVRARHIVVSWAGARGSKQTRSKEEARTRITEALAKIKAGADFADVARTYSEDASAARGGDLGIFRREEMAAPFSNAAFALAPGEISDVVETPFGFHVIQRTR